MTSKKLAVLGAGWLGLPLVGYLIDQGYSLTASYRRREVRNALTAAGADPFLLDLPVDRSVLESFLHQVEVLVVTLPPRGRALGEAAPANYLSTLGPLRGLLSGIHVIFTSSTGVYGGQVQGEVTEETRPLPDTHSGRAVMAAEEWLDDQTDRLTVLRLAGLFGPDRDPTNFFRNAEAISRAEAPVNLVHRDDVLTAIRLVISTGATGIYNLSAVTHPSKGDFYGSLLRAAGCSAKAYLPGGATDKQINSAKIRALGWEPCYDDLTVYSKSNTAG
ncbi:nucleoside-diphosphate-sugar epimerase [Lewinella aquimaris]|uniref:Nucleoside-diphosphate-sugar epimerase n=1 Tax=Neolewinella aquimaris TaxID=1835722 RepID=A0A840EAM0_9BACT|nr:sugar nucleotide-binding protein [Neolewinella aquimaris]MBB4080477.1 nucleoside-diphosphate-sugar epimerase [Neolewinella aquimaris]